MDPQDTQTPQQPNIIEPPTQAPVPPVVTQPQPVVVAPTTTTLQPIENNPILEPVTVDPIIQPISDGSAGTVVPPVVAPKKKKGLVIGIIIAIAVALVGGGSAIAYTVWNSSPEKVMSDAVANAIVSVPTTYTGIISSKNDSMKIVANVTAKQSGKAGEANVDLTITMNDMDYIASGDGIFDQSGALYVKVDVSGIVDVLKAQIGSAGASISTQLDALANQINNKWVKISDGDIGMLGDSYSDAKKCISDIVTNVQNDKSAMDELSGVYNKSPFIKTKKELGTKDGSYGYEITIDQANSKAFGENLKNTKLYNTIKGCDGSSSVDEISSPIMDSIEGSSSAPKDSTDKPTVIVWVDSASRKITKLDVSSTDSSSKTSAVISFGYDQVSGINAPNDYITLSQMISNIQTTIAGISKTLGVDVTTIFQPTTPVYDEYDYSGPTLNCDITTNNCL